MTNPSSEPVNNAQAQAQAAFDAAGIRDNVQATDRPTVDSPIEN